MNPSGNWYEHGDGTWFFAKLGYAVYGIVSPLGDGAFKWEARTLLDARESVRSAPPNGVSSSLDEAKQRVEELLYATGTVEKPCADPASNLSTQTEQQSLTDEATALLDKIQEIRRDLDRWQDKYDEYEDYEGPQFNQSFTLAADKLFWIRGELHALFLKEREGRERLRRENEQLRESLDRSHASFRVMRDRSEELTVQFLRTHTRWIPVTERLPEDSNTVNVAYRIGGSWYITGLAYRERGKWINELDDSAEGLERRFASGDNLVVTHWMPMPEPPALQSPTPTQEPEA